jgi:hypothetical protein
MKRWISQLARLPMHPRVVRAGALMRRWPYNADLIVLCVLLSVTAMGAAMLTASKAGQLLGHVVSQANTSADRKAEVKRLYLSASAYQDYAPTLIRLNPGVTFSLTHQGTALALEIKDPDLYPDLMMALHTMQAFKPSVAWEMNEFCAHKCHGEGIVARAIVKGFTQEIVQ